MASRRAYRVALSSAFVIGTLARVALIPRSALASRLPALICGLILLVWLPRVVARRLGDGPGLATAWILALSPALVTASRLSLPAAASTLFAALAAVAFLRWWMCGSRVAAGLYAPYAALALAFAPRAAPFVLASWAFGAGDLCVRPRTSARPKPSQVVVVALATAAAVTLALSPAVASLLDARAVAASTAGAEAIEDDSRLPWARWMATRHPIIALVLAAAALAGVLLLWRRQRRILLFSVVLVAAQLVALALEPRGAVLANHDLLVALPVVVVWVAVALAEPWRTVQRT